MGHPEYTIQKVQVFGTVLEFYQVVVELFDHLESFDQKIFQYLLKFIHTLILYDACLIWERTILEISA